MPIGTGVDGAAFDAGSQLAFASCGEGTTTIAKEEGPNKLTVVQTLQTERGRANDGDRSDDASDLFANGAVRAGGDAIARSVADAAQDGPEYVQAAGLRAGVEGKRARSDVRHGG